MAFGTRCRCKTLQLESQSWHQLQPLGVEINEKALILAIVAFSPGLRDHESTVEASSLLNFFGARKMANNDGFPQDAWPFSSNWIQRISLMQ